MVEESSISLINETTEQTLKRRMAGAFKKGLIGKLEVDQGPSTLLKTWQPRPAFFP